MFKKKLITVAKMLLQFLSLYQYPDFLTMQFPDFTTLTMLNNIKKFQTVKSNQLTKTLVCIVQMTSYAL